MIKKLFVVALSVLVVASYVSASEANNVLKTPDCVWETCVPKKKSLNGKELPLRAIVPFRYWGFKVYTAALYVPEEVKDIESALGSAPMRLELHYYRKFSAKDFRESGVEVFNQNQDIDPGRFKKQLEKINSLYVPVKEGDSYALTFVPGEGLSLLLNDTSLGTVAGNDFARGYLGIWLSRYSLSNKLTRALTGP